MEQLKIRKIKQPITGWTVAGRIEGKTIFRLFSVEKYGEHEAWRMANEAKWLLEKADN